MPPPPVYFHEVTFSSTHCKNSYDHDNDTICEQCANPCVADEGFRGDVDATHAFAIERRAYECRTNDFSIGFGSTKETNDTKNTNDSVFTIEKKVALSMKSGQITDASLYRSQFGYLIGNACNRAKQVLCVLRITENGKKKTAQWACDDGEGDVVDCSEKFKDATVIFPIVSYISGACYQRHDALALESISKHTALLDEIVRGEAVTKAAAFTKNNDDDGEDKTKKENEKDLRSQLAEKEKANNKLKADLEAEKKKDEEMKERVKQLQEELKNMKKEFGQRRKRE